MEPILHLSLPVHDLATSRWFYVDLLGCELGRVEDGWIDVWFYGMQVTLHEQPEQVLNAEQRGVRHFGVTVSREHFDELLARLRTQPLEWARPLSTHFAGTQREQTKAMVLDPSGNAIELKSYVDPTAAFDTLVGSPTAGDRD
jgi:extradiol dioxygenase family protein